MVVWRQCWRTSGCVHTVKRFPAYIMVMWGLMSLWVFSLFILDLHNQQTKAVWDVKVILFCRGVGFPSLFLSLLEGGMIPSHFFMWLACDIALQPVCRTHTLLTSTTPVLFEIYPVLICWSLKKEKERKKVLLLYLLIIRLELCW